MCKQETKISSTKNKFWSEKIIVSSLWSVFFNILYNFTFQIRAFFLVDALKEFMKPKKTWKIISTFWLIQFWRNNLIWLLFCWAFSHQLIILNESMQFSTNIIPADQCRRRSQRDARCARWMCVGCNQRMCDKNSQRKSAQVIQLNRA